MSRDLVIKAPIGAAFITVAVPERWTGPNDTSELAVLFPEGNSGIVDSFATNTVARFLPADAPEEVFTASDCIIADSGQVRDQGFSRREVLSTSYIDDTAVMQLTTMVDAGDDRTLVVSSVASRAWDRFHRDISEIHASVAVTGGPV